MTNPVLAPHGSWKSPITAELLTAHAISLEQVAIDGETIYWTEGHPEEDGRSVLYRLEPGQPPVECLPPRFSVRSRVYEYGGGAFAVSQGSLFFVNLEDQQLYRQIPGGLPERLSRSDGYRYGDLVCDAFRQRLVCIREDHTRPDLVSDAIVAVPFDGGDGQVLVEGWDFFSNARLSPDGTCLPSPNSETFEHLGGKHEGCNYQGREKLSDRQRRKKRDGHRKFHRHLALDNVLERLFEDGVTTDQGRRDANYADAREWLPKSKPDRSRSEYHEGNANEFGPFNSPRVLRVLSTFSGIPL
jgi:hypothetical protein